MSVEAAVGARRPKLQMLWEHSQFSNNYGSMTVSKQQQFL